jgi:hypothetical protein
MRNLHQDLGLQAVLDSAANAGRRCICIVWQLACCSSCSVVDSRNLGTTAKPGRMHWHSQDRCCVRLAWRLRGQRHQDDYAIKLLGQGKADDARGGCHDALGMTLHHTL